MSAMLGKRRDKRIFRNTAMKTRSINLASSVIMRGGIRL